VCGVGAAASLLVLLFAADRAALVLTIVTDAIAAVPTVTMAWWPSRDRPVPTAPYLSVAFAAVCTLLGGPADVWQIAYPAYLVVLGLVMAGIIIARRDMAEFIVARDKAEFIVARDMAEFIARAPRNIEQARRDNAHARAVDPHAAVPGPRRPPDLLGDATTEERRPAWRSPHAAALRKLIPPDVLTLAQVPGRRVVQLIEHAYASGHQNGWDARGEETLDPQRPSSPTPQSPRPPRPQAPTSTQ
jgi:hypothetical protein